MTVVRITDLASWAPSATNAFRFSILELTISARRSGNKGIALRSFTPAWITNTSIGCGATSKGYRSNICFVVCP